jgi:hypothetical protein
MVGGDQMIHISVEDTDRGDPSHSLWIERGCSGTHWHLRSLPCKALEPATLPEQEIHIEVVSWRRYYSLVDGEVESHQSITSVSKQGEIQQAKQSPGCPDYIAAEET